VRVFFRFVMIVATPIVKTIMNRCPERGRQADLATRHGATTAVYWRVEAVGDTVHLSGGASLRLKRKLDLATGDIAGAVWTEWLVGRGEILGSGPDRFRREVAQWTRRKRTPTARTDRIVTMAELP
jgi:hypothetical protein